MEAERQLQEPVCRSVFKNGRDTISREQFTEKWMEFIEQSEKNKEAVFTRQVCS